jgi:hypothetical protein
MPPRPERSIRIVSAVGKHRAIVNTLPNYAKSPSESSRLVFHKYGNNTSWRRSEPAGRMWRAIRYRVSGRWRSPAVAASPRRGRSSPSPQPTKFSDVLEAWGAAAVAPVFLFEETRAQSVSFPEPSSLTEPIVGL